MTKKMITIGTIGVFILLCFIGLFLPQSISMEKNIAMAEEKPTSIKSTFTINDVEFPEFIYRNEGYNNLSEWWDALQVKRNSFVGSTDKAVIELGEYLVEEDKDTLAMYETKIVKAENFTKIQENEILFNEIVERVSAEKVEAEALIAAQNIITNSSNNYSSYASAVSSGSYSGSYYDFLQAGIVNANGNKYSYYSQSVLPGGGLSIPGRHVDGGFVRDADGYIVLANSADNGTVIDTPWGPGKVYDKGTDGNHYDVYVE